MSRSRNPRSRRERAPQLPGPLVRLAAAAAFAVALLPALAPQAPSATAGDGRPAGAVQRKLPPVAGRLAARPPVPSPAAQEILARRQAETSRRGAEIDRLLGARKISRRSHDHLRARGLGPALLATGPAGKSTGAAAALAAETDTLRILLVRISFDGDRSGNLTSVTTDGDFSFDPDPQVWVDPPPHDRRYFEAQLNGLHEYYRLQSGGRLFVSGRVLPEGARDSYKVGDLADYGPGAGRNWTIEGLERLVRDMIAAADAGTRADGSANLADFDDDDPFTYVVFVHAGSDWQSDINGDSPNDVPTFFVSLGEAARLEAIDSSTGLPGRLSECSVIPETTNQDLPPVERFPAEHRSFGWGGGILAGLCHEFGHALGLPDVYDTWTGAPRVGIWDLMDAGTNVAVPVGFRLPPAGPGLPDSLHVVSATGLLPPSLSAWEKWFLGWLEVAPLANLAGEVRLPAVQVPRTAEEYGRYRTRAGYDFRLGYPQAVYGGASRREFFLVENRWIPGLNDPLPEETGIGLVADEETGVILYLGGDPDPVSGIYRNTGLYDYFLLEGRGGLLVWHVDMARIEAGLADNTINTDGNGLRLVEADGIQDVGVFDQPYALYRYGSERDPFNEPGETLNVHEAPTSRAFDRSWTGLSLSGIEGVDPALAVMKLRPRLEPLLPAPPFELPPRDGAPRALATVSGTPVLLDGTEPVLVVADRGGGQTVLFAVGADGRPRGEGGIVAVLPGSLLGAPILAAAADEGRGALIAGLGDGTVQALSLQPGGPGPLPALWTAAVGPELRRAPAPDRSGALLLCVTGPAGGQGSGELVVLDATGARLGETLPLPAALLGDPLPLPAGAEAGGALWDLPCADGVRRCRLEGSTLALAEPEPYARAPRGAIGGVCLRRGDGGFVRVLADSFGIVAGLPPGALAASKPEIFIVAAADLDADGGEDLLAIRGDRLHALDAAGVELTGWPIRPAGLFPLPEATAIDPDAIVVCDGDGDGINEVHFATGGGHLMTLDARGALRPRTPFLWGEPGRAALAVGPGAGGERVLWLLAEGGRAAPPLERRQLGGRVAGYRLSAAGAVRSSEWLGHRGGSGRAGAVGVPGALEGPAARERRDDPVVLYPNPLPDRLLRVRFHSAGAAPAVLAIYDLQGELVLRRDLTAADGLNDVPLELPELASGLYLCRLQRRGPDGTTTDVKTLAVVR